MDQNGEQRPGVMERERDDNKTTKVGCHEPLILNFPGTRTNKSVVSLDLFCFGSFLLLLLLEVIVDVRVCCMLRLPLQFLLVCFLQLILAPRLLPIGASGVRACVGNLKGLANGGSHGDPTPCTNKQK
jgi:hypothetical protein